MIMPCPVCKDPAAERERLQNEFGILIRCNTCTPFKMDGLQVHRLDGSDKPDMQLSAMIKAESSRRGPSAPYSTVAGGQIQAPK